MPRASALYFDPITLVEFSRFFADEVRSGKYPFVDYDAEDRWHQRIYRDRRMDVWLISWLPTQGTQLHDHGGSSGSFTVLWGELTETVAAGRSGGYVAKDCVHAMGESVGFGAHYVHDVRNLSDVPAASIHVYSAPLSTMNYYDLADGELLKLAQLRTEDPEPELGGLVAS
jgi:hypothetical protein